MKTLILLVVVLLNFNVYLQTYERSRLSKFQAFISGHQSDFENSEVSSYPITLFYTFMESHDDYASFHGSVAQSQHVLTEICVIEICLSSRHSFQDLNNTTFFSFPKRVILKR